MVLVKIDLFRRFSAYQPLSMIKLIGTFVRVTQEEWLAVHVASAIILSEYIIKQVIIVTIIY